MPICSRSRWSGEHYQRTAMDWLANFDARRSEIETVLRGVYGADTALWMRRWRWFLLATAGLFGFSGGSEWGVSHYRMKAVAWARSPAEYSPHHMADRADWTPNTTGMASTTPTTGRMIRCAGVRRRDAFAQ